MHFDCDMPLHAERVPETPWASRGFIDGGASDSIDFTFHLDEDNYCKHCSEETFEYVDGWKHEHNDSRYCDEDEDPANMDEDDLDDIVEESVPWTGWGQWEAEHYTAEPADSAPGNWVGFTINPERQQTQVQISAGDPRGCLTFTLRRWTDPETGENKLLLHLPHPGEGQAHMTLTEHHEGTYIVE